MEDNNTTYQKAGDNVGRFVRKSLLTGTAIVLPVLLTAFVVLIIIDILSGLLTPLVIPIQGALGTRSPRLPQLLSLTVLILTVLFVGAVTESRIGGDRLKRGLDFAMAALPVISSIYGPLDQISTMLLEGDTQNFQDVVLVEFPKEGSYSLAFQTSHPPDQIEQATQDDDMLTVFMPMGPNPFMGGFILHLSEDEVYELDLSVEEGISSIISFGVAVEIDDHPPDIPIELNHTQ